MYFSIKLEKIPNKRTLQVLCLVQGGAGQLCSWVASNLTWAAGARLELSISNIQQVIHMVVLLVLVVALALMGILVVVCFRHCLLLTLFFPGSLNLECWL